MKSTFLEALKSFLKICVPLLGTYVLFLAERSLSIVDPSYKNGVNSPKIYVSFDEKISMKNISFGGKRLLSEYAGILLVERIDFNSLNNTNATHRRIHEPIMDRNIIDVTNDSIKKMIKAGGRYLEHNEKVLRRIANKHKGEIHFICN